MKRLMVLAAALYTTAACGQQKGAAKLVDVGKEPCAFYKKVYHNALAVNDAATAVSNLHSYIACSADGKMYDSLALLYFQTKQYVPAYTLSSDMIKKQPFNDFALEINARSATALSLVQESSEAYGKLMQLHPEKSVFAYEKLQADYGIKRFLEAYMSGVNAVNGLGKDTVTNEWAKQSLTYVDSSKQERVVTGKVYALYLTGICAAKIDRTDEARKLFNMCLTEDKDFLQAKKELDALK